MVERNYVIAGKKSQNRLVENQEGQEHQNTCDGGTRMSCERYSMDKFTFVRVTFTFTDLTE